MNRRKIQHIFVALGVMAGSGLMGANPAHALIQGLTRTTYNFTAKDGYISNPDGTQLYVWGFADNDPGNPAGVGRLQYPGPTLIVAQGATITINLTNLLPEPVSLTFPGQEGVTTPVLFDINTDGINDLRSLTREAAPSGGTASYTFVASQPGTYYYQSGTHVNKQLALGLFGVIIVRSATANQAYNHPDSLYNREYLLLLSEMDDLQSIAADNGLAYDTTSWEPGYWMINGRSASDTMADDFVPYLPYQPYGAMVRMHPGETILLRIVNLGRDPHPFHTHGNHVKIIARDGRLLKSPAGTGADLAESEFTVDIAPGQTIDGLFTWSAAGLGWDVYGHTASQALQIGEYGPDHGKPIPTGIPYFTALQYGEWFSGSPFLGSSGELPPANPRLNDTNAFVFMWHSHRESEMTNKNDFPGGMMTMLMIEAPWVPIP